jgi:hypothetical protein
MRCRFDAESCAVFAPSAGSVVPVAISVFEMLVEFYLARADAEPVPGYERQHNFHDHGTDYPTKASTRPANQTPRTGSPGPIAKQDLPVRGYPHRYLARTARREMPGALEPFDLAHGLWACRLVAPDGLAAPLLVVQLMSRGRATLTSASPSSESAETVIQSAPSPQQGAPRRGYRIARFHFDGDGQQEGVLSAARSVRIHGCDEAQPARQERDAALPDQRRGRGGYGGRSGQSGAR